MKFLNPDTSFFNNFYDKAKYLLAWRITVVLLVSFFITTLFYISSGFWAMFSTVLTFVIAAGALTYLYYTKNFKPLFWVYTLVGILLPNFAMNTVMNLTHYVDFLWMISGTILAFVGLGRRVGIVVLFCNFLLSVFFFLFTLNKHIETLEPRAWNDLIGETIELSFAFFILGYLTNQYFIFQSYSESELKKANNELQIQNKVINTKINENNLLLKEVHHRVKNNLQIITSLLRLQKSNLPNFAQQKFDDAIDRIMTMAIIHRKLYQSEDISYINIDSYVKDLITNVAQSIAFTKNIKIEVNTEINTVGLKTVVPLGLIINELISNSFKHTFNKKPEGKISIHFKPIGKYEFEFTYTDFGEWVETEKQGFGLELIETLTTQLEGKMYRDGSNYKFLLKNLDII